MQAQCWIPFGAEENSSFYELSRTIGSLTLLSSVNLECVIIAHPKICHIFWPSLRGDGKMATRCLTFCVHFCSEGKTVVRCCILVLLLNLHNNNQGKFKAIFISQVCLGDDTICERRAAAFQSWETTQQQSSLRPFCHSTMVVAVCLWQNFLCAQQQTQTFVKFWIYPITSKNYYQNTRAKSYGFQWQLTF